MAVWLCLAAKFRRRPQRIEKAPYAILYTTLLTFFFLPYRGKGEGAINDFHAGKRRAAAAYQPLATDFLLLQVPQKCGTSNFFDDRLAKFFLPQMSFVFMGEESHDGRIACADLVTSQYLARDWQTNPGRSVLQKIFDAKGALRWRLFTLGDRVPGGHRPSKRPVE